MKVHTTDALGHPIKQGSREWHRLRLGIPTCSRFGEIMTAKTREYSKSARAYIGELLAEKMLGEPISWGATGFTERGTALEPRALQFYELERGVDVERVGFITDDSHTEGGSPDGLVGEDGGLETKCYGAKHHMSCLLGEADIASPLQVQGYLRLTGRKWWDCLAFSEPSEITGKRLPPKLVRVYRDEEYIDTLDACLVQFKAELARAGEKLALIGPEGVIDGSDLHAQLIASLRAGVGSHPEALTPDEIDALRERIHEHLDEADQRQFYNDVDKGRWEEVRRMKDHLDRLTTLEVV